MNAILVIDKPSGITSHDVVNQVRRITRERSVGHLGTLDPMASGVLPLVLGKFTRLAQFYTSSEKEYEGTIHFGFSTDTYDADGEPSSSPVEFKQTLAAVQAAAAPFIGTMQQKPPAFSAKKIAGVPAYKLARQDKDQPVELKPVEVTVSKLDITDLTGNLASFKAAVSAGTYIRSLAHDLGQQLACGAHLASLRRTRSGEFRIEQAISLESLRSLTSDNGDYVNCGTGIGFVHPRAALTAFPAITADEASLAKIRHGNAVNLPEFSGAKHVKVFAGRDDLVAIARRVAGSLFQPCVVLI